MHGSQPSELLNNDRYGSRRKVHRFFAIFDCLEHALPLSNVAHAAADTDAGADAGIVHALLSSSLSMLAVSFVSRLDRPTSPQAWPPGRHKPGPLPLAFVEGINAATCARPAYKMIWVRSRLQACQLLAAETCAKFMLHTPLITTRKCWRRAVSCSSGTMTHKMYPKS